MHISLSLLAVNRSHAACYSYFVQVLSITVIIRNIMRDLLIDDGPYGIMQYLHPNAAVVAWLMRST